MSATISIQVFDRFDRLAQAFPGVLNAQASQDIFYTPEWFATLSRYGDTFQGTTQLIVAHDGNTNATHCLPTVDGHHLNGMSNYYASLYGPIGDTSQVSDEVCQALCHWIFTQAKKWPQLNFHPLDTGQPFFSQMLNALRRAGYWADSYRCFGNWYLDLAGRSYAQYFATLPSRLRHTIERNQRRMQKAGQVDIEIHQQPGTALEKAIKEFASVYQKSWKPAESHPDFIAQLCRITATNGWLRLGILKFQGESVAAQIWLVYAGKANIFKLAYIEGKNQFSAGTLLTAELMRHVIDSDHVREVDYLSGDDAYKQDWMSNYRERKGIIAFDPRTVRGRFMSCRHTLGKFIKRLKCSSTI